jgi:hypothetical protein
MSNMIYVRSAAPVCPAIETASLCDRLSKYNQRASIVDAHSI